MKTDSVQTFPSIRLLHLSKNDLTLVEMFMVRSLIFWCQIKLENVRISDCYFMLCMCVDTYVY